MALARWSLVCLLVIIAALVNVRADTFIWTGTESGLWTDGANWDQGVAPSNGTDFVVISSDGCPDCIITLDESVSVFEIRLSGSNTSKVTLEVVSDLTVSTLYVNASHLEVSPDGSITGDNTARILVAQWSTVNISGNVLVPIVTSTVLRANDGAMLMSVTSNSQSYFSGAVTISNLVLDASTDQQQQIILFFDNSASVTVANFDIVNFQEKSFVPEMIASTKSSFTVTNKATVYGISCFGSLTFINNGTMRLSNSKDNVDSGNFILFRPSAFYSYGRFEVEAETNLYSFGTLSESPIPVSAYAIAAFPAGSSPPTSSSSSVQTAAISNFGTLALVDYNTSTTSNTFGIYGNLINKGKIDMNSTGFTQLGHITIYNGTFLNSGTWYGVVALVGSDAEFFDGTALGDNSKLESYYGETSLTFHTKVTPKQWTIDSLATIVADVPNFDFQNCEFSSVKITSSQKYSSVNISFTAGTLHYLVLGDENSNTSFGVLLDETDDFYLLAVVTPNSYVTFGDSFSFSQSAITTTMFLHEKSEIRFVGLIDVSVPLIQIFPINGMQKAGSVRNYGTIILEGKGGSSIMGTVSTYYQCGETAAIKYHSDDWDKSIVQFDQLNMDGKVILYCTDCKKELLGKTVLKWNPSGEIWKGTLKMKFSMEGSDKSYFLCLDPKGGTGVVSNSSCVVPVQVPACGPAPPTPTPTPLPSPPSNAIPVYVWGIVGGGIGIIVITIGIIIWRRTRVDSSDSHRYAPIDQIGE